MARGVIAIVAALLLAIAIVRNAAVAAFTDDSPMRAAQLWPGHPSAELSLAMTEIGRATHERQPVGQSVFARVDAAAVKAPLAAEPFLVQGVQAQLAGDLERARGLFLAAELRDPRSLPARYFLAELYFRAGDAHRGLAELAALARLTPRGAESMAQHVAAYAKDRSNWPELRALFRSDTTGIENATLGALAADPANADTILAIATKERIRNSTWLPVLLNRLVDAGQYAKARTIWASAAGKPLNAGDLLYDSGFNEPKAPPPFNWKLTSSTVGLSERQPGGRLHVIFYGQEDGVLAQQLLLLSPGAYRLTMRVSGDLDRARALSWSVRCGKSSAPIASVTLDAAARGLSFRVPAGCAGQWLELSGRSSDISQQSDVTITDLKLTTERPSA
jgi:hypothetical protein